MNKVVLIGRLTKEPELRFTAGEGIAVSTFTLAVERNFKNAQGDREADFINCRAWRKTAELVANNLSKGNLIGVSGAIQTGKYVAQDGSTRYYTEVVIDEIKFLEKKGNGHQPGANPMSESSMNDGFFPVDGDDDIPF